MKLNLQEAIENRRSIYTISNEPVASDARIQEIVEFAVKHAPSGFNSQSGRVVVLLGEAHKALWDITTEELRKVSSQDFAPTEEKMKAFASGYGSILFFEDQAVVKGLQEAFPSFSAAFPDHSLQSSGMLQYIVWTALSSEGFGATLQHYNPVIDDAVKAKWDIPESWKLLAEMPFGKPTAAAGDKEFQPIENRVKVYNA